MTHTTAPAGAASSRSTSAVRATIPGRSHGGCSLDSMSSNAGLSRERLPSAGRAQAVLGTVVSTLGSVAIGKAYFNSRRLWPAPHRNCETVIAFDNEEHHGHGARRRVPQREDPRRRARYLRQRARRRVPALAVLARGRILPARGPAAAGPA